MRTGRTSTGRCRRSSCWRCSPCGGASSGARPKSWKGAPQPDDGPFRDGLRGDGREDRIDAREPRDEALGSLALLGPRVLRRVLEQIHEHLLDQHHVERGDQIARQIDLGGARTEHSAAGSSEAMRPESCVSLRTAWRDGSDSHPSSAGNTTACEALVSALDRAVRRFGPVASLLPGARPISSSPSSR
jgi:hypothetical protein